MQTDDFFNKLKLSFPVNDQGHPQTDLTRRAASIMEIVAMTVANETPDFKAYNFIQQRDHVAFCISYDDGWVTWGAIGNNDLYILSDMVIVSIQVDRWHKRDEEREKAK